MLPTLAVKDWQSATGVELPPVSPNFTAVKDVCNMLNGQPGRRVSRPKGQLGWELQFSRDRKRYILRDVWSLLMLYLRGSLVWSLLKEDI